MSLVKVENINVIVDNKTVLDNLSFEIEEKGVYAILAKSALQRTTLAKALAGIAELDGGKIFYKDNELCGGKKGNAVKAKIGYLPQKSFLYPDMTVYEILDLTGKLRKVSVDKRIRQIKEALELVILSDKSEALVKSLDAAETKRLLLANALIGNPSVLILDEPTVSLPPDDVALVKEIVAMLGEKKTVIIFTDKVALANDTASNIGIMSKGKIELWSSLENIKQKLNNDPNALLKTFIAFSDDGEGGKR